jgi:hypothetical protein
MVLKELGSFLLELAASLLVGNTLCSPAIV